MLDSSLAGFAVSTGFWGDRVELAVRGEVDILTASDLGGLVDAVIESGYRFVVLDLAASDFLDASGLRVIARGARQLVLAGGRLTIRSPSVMVQRILDISGLSKVVRLEQPGAASHLGPEELGGPALTPYGPAPHNLAQHVRTLTAIPADNDVIDRALQLVVALASATVGGADGVSVSLRRNGRLATVAASDQTISNMDADQYTTGEGPCVDASVEGRWFHVEALADEQRWPAFIPRARALGINAILSSPLLARDRPVGALNIYSRTAAVFTPEDQRLAALFASEASTILADARLEVADDELAGRVAQALRARQVIAQAQGVIMQREGVDEDAAYTALRRSSIRTGTPLREHAERVVAATSPAGPAVGPAGSTDA